MFTHWLEFCKLTAALLSDSDAVCTNLDVEQCKHHLPNPVLC